MASVKGGAAARRRLNQIAKAAKKSTLRVGFLEKSKYPDGKSVALVAALNEYGHTVRGGSYFVLPRPFFRNMIEKNKGAWPAKLSGIFKKKDFDVVLTFRAFGELVQGQLKKSINDFTTPPLAESTIARKGFAKPLIDTAVMINSVDFEISTK